MTWFKNWFDSPYYHILYKNRNEKEAKSFIDNLINYLQIPNKSKVLDIACGKEDILSILIKKVWM